MLRAKTDTLRTRRGWGFGQRLLDSNLGEGWRSHSERCKSEPAGRAGESAGRGEGVPLPGRCRHFPVQCPVPSPGPVHLCTGNFTPASAFTAGTPQQPTPPPAGFRGAGRGSARPPRTLRPSPASLQKQPRQVHLAAGGRLGTGPSEPLTVTLGMLSGACRLGDRTRGCPLLPPVTAPALPRAPQALGLPARRRRGRAARRAVMWRDSLRTAAGYTRGAAARLRSALSSRKLQP